MKTNNITDEMLSELLKGLDDGIEVPEEVTESWTAAVRHESRIIKLDRFTRSFGSLAAAIAVIIGATLLLRNNNVLPKEKPIAPAAVYSVAAQDYPVALAADGESDEFVFTNRSAEQVTETGIDGKDLLISAECGFEAESAQAAELAVNNSLSGIDGYIYCSTVSKSEAVFELRVLNDNLDALISALKASTKNFTVTINRIPADEGIYSAQERLDAAYMTLSVLKSEMELADSETALKLNAQISELCDEIDSLERLINTYRNDLSYARVSIKAEIGGFGQKLLTSIGNFWSGFGSDFTITTIITLPILAIIAACVFVIRKKAK